MRIFTTKRNTKLQVILSVMCCVALYSCVRDYIKPIASAEYSPLLAVPLINSNMTVRDLLVKENKNGNIQTDSTNFLTLVYRGRLFSLEADKLINIPAQNYSVTTPAIIPADTTVFNPLPIGSNLTLTPFNDTISFNTGGTADIDSVIFQNGTMLNFTISSWFTQNATIYVTIPHAKKNGIPLKATFSVNYTGTVPVSVNNNIDVSGYTFDMTEGGTTNNKFNMRDSIVLNKSTTNPLQLSDFASIGTGFTNPLFQKLFGYILQPTLSPNQDTVPITIFSNTVPGGGNFTIVNPSVRLIVTNSYGVPITTTINTLEGYNPGFLPYPITINEPKLEPWNMPYPSITQIGQSARDSVTLSNANTANSITNVVNDKPSYFIYSVNSEANPAGKPTWPNTNFVLDTSHFTVDFQLNLPLYGTASNIVLMDTLPLSLTSINQNTLQSLLIRINATNGFPINMGFQAYFVDSISPTQQYNVLDSVVSPYQAILPSASVDTTTGVVLVPSNKITNNTFDLARANKILKAKKIIIKGMFTTANGGKSNVKIFSTYFLDIKIGVEAQLQTKI